jgi:hypothetical protein
MMLMEPECLYGGRGMTEWELEHLIHHRRELSDQNHSAGQGAGAGKQNDLTKTSSTASQHSLPGWADHLVEGVNSVMLGPLIEEERKNVSQRLVQCPMCDKHDLLITQYGIILDRFTGTFFLILTHD